jgi:hypothetical protein
MAGGEIVIAAVATGGYVANKLFATTLESMGDDINKLYVKGRDKIIEVATKKIENPEDGKKVNVRAARDVLWNGAICEDEVCAEYFGGLLAAARSIDGKDDAVVNYVDTIKAMSAKQLELHYIIYKAWQELLKKSGKQINVGLSTDVHACHVLMSGKEVGDRNIPYDRDLTVLYKLHLLHQYRHDRKIVTEGYLDFIDVIPTTFGAQLFAVAHNKLNSWHDFGKDTYESAEGIKGISLIAENMEQLYKVCEVTKKINQ